MQDGATARYEHDLQHLIRAVRSARRQPSMYALVNLVQRFEHVLRFAIQTGILIVFKMA